MPLAARRAVDDASDARRETLNAARERDAVLGLDDEMDVIGLDGEMDDATG